jgi:metal-responsive CopG/Arc/MetJ family transcriptional regulator
MMNSKQSQDRKSRTVAVMIESDLYEELQKIVKNSGFASVDDYIAYVLRSQVGKKSEELSIEDTEAVTSRLKALGYI